jgi:hypothetical protein
MDLTEILYEDVDLILLVQDRERWRIFVNTVMNIQVSYEAGNFWTSRATVSL